MLIVERVSSASFHALPPTSRGQPSITVGEVTEQWLEVVELEETTRDRYEDVIGCPRCRRSAGSKQAASTPSCWSATRARLRKCKRPCPRPRAWLPYPPAAAPAALSRRVAAWAACWTTAAGGPGGRLATASTETSRPPSVTVVWPTPRAWRSTSVTAVAPPMAGPSTDVTLNVVPFTTVCEQ